MDRNSNPPIPPRSPDETRSVRPNRMPSPMVPEQSASMTVGDIYYVLFRHKWRILLCSLAGFAAAAALYFLRPPPFLSEAKLFIRYVVTDSKTPGPGADDERLKSPDQRGETIMDSEEEILTSLDLSKQVAEAVGAEKILAKLGGGKDLNRAASVVQHNLVVEVPPHSSVIRVAFRHPDPEVVQPVLREVIAQYLKMHVEIHRAVGIIGDFLTQETDQLRARLAQTEDDLRKARNKAGVISLEESKKAFSDQITRIRQDIFSAQAELAERSSVFEQLTKQTPATSTAATGAEQPVPPEKVAEYRSILSRLDLQQKREQELLTQFTEENSRVKDVRAQLEETRSAKKKLEDEFPRLLRGMVAPLSQGANVHGPGAIDLTTEAARLTALQSKIKVLNAQLDQVRGEAGTVDQVEGSILELKRKKELEENNYRYYAASLEQSRINEALGNGKVSNISQIQTPSPPAIDEAKTFKILVGIVVGGIVAGIVWAFLIELYFDRTVRRPIDVERMLGLPLFLSIPAMGKKRRLLSVKPDKRIPLELQSSNGNGTLVPAGGSANSELARAENSLLLHTFHETLRDRLISYFESRNLIHKPKLVAVTGLGTDSGVTTTAAGLASCLSETGEGNVLLVDMTVGQGSAQQFYHGKEVVGLEEILSIRDNAQVQDKLYVVAEEPSGDKLSRILPQRFTKLVPKLKASNFDYIIFDMPPVSQISITPRLAGFMDMVLLVIESEKTDQDLVRRAAALLAQSKAHVGAVLNKTRNYVPGPLHQEYLGSI